MKRFILLIVVCVCCSYIYAGQKYTSFIVKGDVSVIENGISRPMKRGEVFDESVVVSIAQGAYLTLKSSDKKRHTLTVNKPYTGTIKKIKSINGAKVKRSNSFMDVIHGKTADDFVKEGRRTMSAGGYNTRDIFLPEEERQALDELHALLQEADLVD